MKEILSDIDKFKRVNVKPGKELNCLLQNFVPVDNFNKNNKNDSPNKLILAKKSR